ncbi:MAG TPA: rhomboid family intramembrane serine protease [Gaiellaceae bacterium]|nr:rhomboid family intramembrane serine protease [Gaiellaceae bacterium]
MPTCYRHPDRETGLSCSECGRPICTDCVTFAPVGLRCPDHAGNVARATPRAVRSVQRGVRRPLARRGVVIPSEAIVTRILVLLNVVVYLITVAQGAGLNDPGGSLFDKWALYGPAVDHGDWWRLITAAFLHASVLHILFNMLALWWLGAPVEMVLGRVRFLGLYIVSGLAGSAGALVADPHAVTVGASGAIFGLLGAGLILEWQGTGSLAGNYLTLIVINLAISFAVPGISIGGHVGGLIGGILATLAFARFGRGHAAYGRLGLIGAVSLVVIAVGSILIAYWKVRGLA